MIEWLVNKWWDIKEWWWDKRNPYPVGTDSFRPAANVEGSLRFNESTEMFEIYSKGEWVILNTECPYCMDKTLGEVYYDQHCLGCVRRMSDE